MEYVKLKDGSQYVPGIYLIKSNNGKVYVGSATKLRGRFMMHRCTLQKNKHDNARLQNYFNKYGEGSLVFEVIEYCNKELLIEREQFWIDKLNPFFNIARTAGATYGLKPWLGKKHTDKTKEKISQSNLTTFAKRAKKEKPLKLTKEENIKRFSEINKTPEARKRMSEMQKGNTHWLGKKHKPETIAARMGAGNGRARKVFCFELNKTFDCCKNAGTFFGVGKAAITNSVKRGNKINGKYTLQYAAN